MASLTRNQHDVLRLLLNGMNTSEIATQIHRSERAINNVRSTLLEIFEAKTTIGLIVEAIKYGFLDAKLYKLVQSHVDNKNDILSMQEASVLFEILSGKTNPQIAQTFSLSKHMVQYHRANVTRKWRVSSKADLVIKAILKKYLILTPVNFDVNPEQKSEIWSMFHDSIKITDMQEYRRIYSISYSFPKTHRKCLTPRQLEVFQLKVMGYSDEAVSSQMDVSEAAVRNYYRIVKDQLSIDTPGKLILKAITMRLITMPILEPNKQRTLSNPELILLLLLFESLSFEEISATMRRSVDELMEMVEHRKNDWKVSTIEGLLYEGLKRGEISLDMLSM